LLSSVFIGLQCKFDQSAVTGVPGEITD